MSCRPWLWFALLSAAHALAAQGLPPDLVALRGVQLPRLQGVPVKDIVAVAAHGGHVVAVHLQIDPRWRGSDGRWHYAFESGAEPRPAGAAGLGVGDLVLLAVPEGGDRLDPTPPGATEIEVGGGRGGTARWFYLERGPLPTPTPLVRYDDAIDRIAGQDYALGFSRGTAVIDWLALGDPQRAGNILDRSKARLDADLAFGIGHLSRNEDDVRVRVTGIHVGPLRIILESEARGRMFLGWYSAPTRDIFVFYPHGFTLPATIRLTPTARLLARNVRLRISMDLNVAAMGMRFESAPDMPVAVAIDGRGGRRAGRQPIAWYLLRRGSVGLLGWLQAPAAVARDVTLYYRDDFTHADPPERVRGEYGDHGFLFRHAGALPAGTLRLATNAWVLHGAALDHPTAALRSFATRPSVRVH